MTPAQVQSLEDVEIRHCRGIEEKRACVSLQQEVWGFAEIDLVPLRMFVVAEKIGGQVIGAFEHGRLAGFCMSVPGIRNGHSYLHSHMLAVRKEYQNRGLGRALKLWQREDAIKCGIDLMEWTFDPLEIKNAFLNIERLGAIARRYTINQYGITSSPLQGGLPTDRLVAEWWLRSRRVEAVLKHGQHPPVSHEVTLEVPAEIYEWKKRPETRPKALEVQTRNREVFLRSFASGMSVLGYERDKHGNGKFLIGKWDEDWSYASK